MFAKIIKNNSISVCLNYVTRAKHDGHPEIKREWYYLGSDGVRFREGQKDWRKRVINDLKRPNANRNPIKDPCGHTSLEFSPEDTAKLTDELMLKIALEYMERMSIKDTPYVIVRHVDKPHPHCHIVFSRVNYDGKIIESATDWLRNGDVCEDITRKYGLTLGKDKMSVDVTKLKGKERARYEIAQGIRDAFVHCSAFVTDFEKFQSELKKRGITAKKLLNEKGEVKTIIYKKGRYSFKASKIDKRFTPKSLEEIFANHREFERQQIEASKPKSVYINADGTIKPISRFMGIDLTLQQQKDYAAGRSVRLDVCVDGYSGPIYLKFDPQTLKPHTSLTDPDAPSQSTSVGNASISHGFESSVPIEEQGFAGGGGLTWPEFQRLHPELSPIEALRRYRAIKRGQDPNANIGRGMHM